MKWAAVSALIVAVSSCSAQCSGSPAASTQGPNLVVNGDFESPAISGNSWTLIANGGRFSDRLDSRRERRRDHDFATQHDKRSISSGEDTSLKGRVECMTYRPPKV